MEQEDKVFSEVVRSYRQNGSILKTAAELGISTVKVRRILITMGLWSSGTSVEIGRLYDQGLTVGEIAKKLSITEKNVQAYIPYSKGTYGKETYDAQMSRDYRIRQRHAAENIVGRGIEKKTQENRNVSGNTDVMKLKLTLDTSYAEEDEMEILRKYGGVKEGITRTVLVPAEMPLHALHYLINKAFGWQNSHLHNFKYTEDVTDTLTDGGKLNRWSELCGIYFRFPEEAEDIFWDDDYDGGSSIKTWMRRKYCGPYADGCRSEQYKNCQERVRQLRKHYSVINIRESFSEMCDRRERTGEHDGPRIKGKKKFSEATIEELQSAITFEYSFCELIERNELCRILSVKPEAVDQMKGQMPVPAAKSLYYSYDYGDDWGVTIDCIAEYTEGANGYVDQDGSTSEDQELQKLLRIVGLQKKPVCIEADGLPVMDDAGGVSGYIRTLKEIREDGDEDSREWARMQGWTGRKVKPENIL